VTAGHDVAGGGEEGTLRVVGAVVLGFWRSKVGLEGSPADRDLAGDGNDAVGHGVAGGGEETNLGKVGGGLRVPAGERALEKSRTVVRVPAMGASGAASDRIVREVWEEEGRRRPLRKEKRKKALAVGRGPCFL
jgi:hypothetical protein